MKKLEGNISISKPICYGVSRMNIEIQDENSDIKFLELSLSLEDFTRAITGQACIPIEFEIRGLDNVGKIKEQKELVFEMPKSNYGEQRIIDALKYASLAAEPGWSVNNYFSSQNSFFQKDDKYYARTTQYRYMEKK